AQLADVEVVVDAGAQSGDHRLDLVVLQHPVDPGLLHVQDLAADGQDGLEPGIPAALGRAACRVPLDHVELPLSRVPGLAARHLPAQAAAAAHAPPGPT